MAIQKGNTVKFLGYSEEMAEEDMLLTEGQTYEVVAINAKEKSIEVKADNADFDPDTEESEDNAKYFITEAFLTEVELVVPKGKPAAKVAAKPTAVPAKAKGKAAAKHEEPEEAEEEAEEEVAAKPAAKAKVAAKPAAKGKAKVEVKAKGKAKGKADTKPAAEEPADKFGELESEDSEILELVEGAEDILDLAKELAEENVAMDWKLGGVLFHVRLSGAFKGLDERYAEKGAFGKKSGFELYLNEVLNIEYRKAMHLISIYHTFSLHGIDGAKLAEIGWTKASKIVPLMTEDNSEELISLAEESSVSELTDAIKESYTTEGGTKGEVKKRIMFKFRLFEANAMAVQETLTNAAADLGLKSVDDAFEHIVMEWAAEHPSEAPAEEEVKPKVKAKTAPGKAAATAPMRSQR